VCLDLGSKSAEATLYPRSAEIMAVGGGIVQFDSGSPSPAGLATLAQRRATSARSLVALIHTMMARPGSEVADENRRLQSEYIALRNEAGKSLLHAIVTRVRGGAVAPKLGTDEAASRK
jgi:hypothetical protein